MPTQASTASTGAIIAGPTPFSIADLGVSLAIGESVYVGVQPRDSLGNSNSLAFLQAKVTRANLSATKILQFSAGGSLAAYAPSGGYTRTVDTVESLSVTDVVAFTGIFDLPDGCTITAVSYECFEAAHGFQKATECYAYAASIGAAFGAAFASLTGTGANAWETRTATVSQSTTGKRLCVDVYLWTTLSGVGDMKVRTIQITYLPADTQATR